MCTMNAELKRYCKEFDLKKRSIEYAKQYLCNFKDNNPEEFDVYFSRYALQDMIANNFDDVRFETLKIGYEIRPNQKNQELLSVVMNIMTYDQEDKYDYQVCIYYCYYNLLGEFFDDCIE